MEEPFPPGAALLFSATALAAFSPMAALALFVLVALAYVAPGLLAEAAERHRQHQSE